MNRFEPIEPDLVESAHMAVLRMKEAALNELARDIDVDPSVLLALSEDTPEAAPPEDQGSEALEALKAILQPETTAIDEPLEEERAECEDGPDFDPWASELLETP